MYLELTKWVCWGGGGSDQTCMHPNQFYTFTPHWRPRRRQRHWITAQAAGLFWLVLSIQIFSDLQPCRLLGLAWLRSKITEPIRTVLRLHLLYEQGYCCVQGAERCLQAVALSHPQPRGRRGSQASLRVPLCQHVMLTFTGRSSCLSKVEAGEKAVEAVNPGVPLQRPGGLKPGLPPPFPKEAICRFWQTERLFYPSAWEQSPGAGCTRLCFLQRQTLVCVCVHECTQSMGRD